MGLISNLQRQRQNVHPTTLHRVLLSKGLCLNPLSSVRHMVLTICLKLTVNTNNVVPFTAGAEGGHSV